MKHMKYNASSLLSVFVDNWHNLAGSTPGHQTQSRDCVFFYSIHLYTRIQIYYTTYAKPPTLPMLPRMPSLTLPSRPQILRSAHLSPT
jgi:hypothetical protein